tara:strand:- start:464 stop:1183 length:720 start_codon:yes stop_codon:yes gene_type:complete
MKIAVLLFGQPRYCDDSKPQKFLKSIIEKYNADVYAHAWFESKADYQISSWALNPPDGKGITKNPVPDNALDIINDAYSPKKFKVDSPQKFELSKRASNFIFQKWEGPHINERNISNIKSQLTSIGEVARLYEESGDEHDLYILARYDAWAVGFPELDNLPTDKFYVADHHPNFPDIIQFGGRKFFDWMKNCANDMDKANIYQKIWEPSPEAFKMFSFLKRHSSDDIIGVPMEGFVIRR